MERKAIIVSFIGKMQNLEKNFIYVAKEDDKKGLKFETLCPAKDNKYERIDIIERVVKFAVADYKRMQSDNITFGKLLGIDAKSLLKNKLSYNYMFVTDATGKVVTVISSEIPFRDTELKISDKHTLLSATRKNLKAAIFNHAKYVEKQMSIYTQTYALMYDIDDQIILAEKEEKEAEKSGQTKQNEVKKETKKETKTA